MRFKWGTRCLINVFIYSTVGPLIKITQGKFILVFSCVTQVILEILHEREKGSVCCFRSQRLRTRAHGPWLWREGSRCACVPRVWEVTWAATGYYWCISPHTVCLKTRDNIWKWVVSHKKKTKFLASLENLEEPAALGPPTHMAAICRRRWRLPAPDTCSSVCRGSARSAAASPSAHAPAHLPRVPYLPASADVWIRNCSTFSDILWSSNSSLRPRRCKPHSVAGSGSSVVSGWGSLAPDAWVPSWPWPWPVTAVCCLFHHL